MSNPFDQNTQQLFNKMNSIFERTLGCKFEFHKMSELENDGHWSNSDIASLRQHGAEDRPRYIESLRGHHYGFPVAIDESCIGIAVVQNSTSSDSKYLIMLADLLSFILQSSLQGHAQLDKISGWEEQLRLMSATSEPSSNVIPLRAAKNKSKNEIETTNYDESAIAEFRSEVGVTEKGPLTTKPILIEASEGFPFQRLVVEIHQLTDRWALLSTNDLPADIFHSKEKLSELGGITLYIPNLADLSLEAQLKLAEYLSQPNDADSPQVVAGIHESLETLELTQKVQPHLLHLFYHTSLRWTEERTENQKPVLTLEEQASSTKEIVDESLTYMDEEIRRLHRVRDNLIPFHHQYFDPDHTTLH